MTPLLQRHPIRSTLYILLAVSPLWGHRAKAQESLNIQAQLTPVQQTILSSEIASRIDGLSLKEGDSFTAGQILVRFDCAVAEARLEEADAALTALEKKLEVLRNLRKYNSSTAMEIGVAAANAAKAKAKVKGQTAVVSKCVLAAPFSGKVAELKVFNHQFVKAGDELMRILDDSVLEVEFLVPSNWLGWLKPGLGFRISINETGRTYKAGIVRLGAEVDPLSKSVKVMGRISGKHAELISGMSGMVRMTPP